MTHSYCTPALLVDQQRLPQWAAAAGLVCFSVSSLICTLHTTITQWLKTWPAESLIWLVTYASGIQASFHWSSAATTRVIVASKVRRGQDTGLDVRAVPKEND